MTAFSRTLRIEPAWGGLGGGWLGRGRGVARGAVRSRQALGARYTCGQGIAEAHRQRKRWKCARERRWLALSPHQGGAWAWPRAALTLRDVSMPLDMLSVARCTSELRSGNQTRRTGLCASLRRSGARESALWQGWDGGLQSSARTAPIWWFPVSRASTPQLADDPAPHPPRLDKGSPTPLDLGEATD